METFKREQEGPAEEKQKIVQETQRRMILKSRLLTFDF